MEVELTLAPLFTGYAIWEQECNFDLESFSGQSLMQNIQLFNIIKELIDRLSFVHLFC